MIPSNLNMPQATNLARFLFGEVISLRRTSTLSLSHGAEKETFEMNYVDGFLVPVPKKNLPAYRRMARKAGKIWMKHGALAHVECAADDVKPGKLTSFPQSVKLKPGETVIFSWFVYKSRRDRDRVNAAVMKDPWMAGMDMKSMPFDGKRMIYGGFKVIVES